MALWRIAEGEEVAAAHARLALLQPARSLLLNRDALDADCTGGVVPRLAIAEEGFAPSLFLDGDYYVSRRLRDIMKLPADTATFVPVDASASTSAVHAAGYAALRVTFKSDPIDPDASDGEMVDALMPDGSIGLAWQLAGGPGRPAPRVVVHSGFRPPAPLFGDSHGQLIATDGLADRVLRAGIADVRFIALEQERGQAEAVCKRL